METQAGVTDGDAHLRIFALGLNQQLPRTILDLSHSLRGIGYQVEHDLLELDSIASEMRKVAGSM
jgi:hypothetical protein